MLIGNWNQLKLTISKYPYFFIFAFIIFNFSTLDCYAQKPHIEDGLFKEGLLELKFKENWDVKKLGIIGVASVIPFGTFYIEKKYLKNA